MQFLSLWHGHVCIQWHSTNVPAVHTYRPYSSTNCIASYVGVLAGWLTGAHLPTCLPTCLPAQVGRLLGGVATSLLFSAFESWLVAEHFSRGFDEKWLGDTFSKVGVGEGG